MSKVEFIRELSGFMGKACLVKRGDEFFVVSSVNAPFTGPETLHSPDQGRRAAW
jgi:hypothetical protein